MRSLSLLGLLSLAMPLQAADGLGMTFGNTTNASTGGGVVFVTCHGLPRTEGGGCDAYRGDTPCAARLPLLCLRVDGRRRPEGLIVPPAAPAAAMPAAFYAGWAAGHVAATAPLAGIELGSPQQADQICSDAFGDGWRMAEFHDGRVDAAGGRGGWAWYAYGRLDTSTRYWVRIDDTPANCWDGSDAQRLFVEPAVTPEPADGRP